MYAQELFSDALREPTPVIGYHVGRHLATLFPDRAMIEGDDWDFQLLDFARAGRCSAIRDETIHGQFAVRWSDDRGILDEVRNAWFEVAWQGHALDLVMMDWDDGCSPHHWIVAETEAIARGFYAEVCAFDPEVRDEVLVFDGGRWAESGRLFDQIGGATLDNLILPERLRRDLFADVARFFDSRAAYEKHGVPWKRGLLLLGPPGNGKTHAIKALINATGRPCLYVKTFRSENVTEATCIRRVFDRARKASPCILVLEDLDSLVTDESRSFFLNELDGFAANVGILTIATTNHPARLDPAILDRPSRFDRKYHFALPEIAERRAFIDRWNASLDPEARLGPDAESAAAENTPGFSFAYLKELFLSSLMAWIAEPGPRSMDAILLEQAAALRDQMESTAEARGADRK